MTWEPSSVNVRWRLLLSVVIVTHLVTRPLVSWLETASALLAGFVSNSDTVAAMKISSVVGGAFLGGRAVAEARPKSVAGLLRAIGRA